MSHVLISCKVSFENDHTWPRNKHWYLNMCLHLTYPSSQNAEPLLASKRQYKGFHLEAHVSFEHAKPRKPWYLFWKQMSTSASNWSPISHPHSDFEPDVREIRESLGDLTSASPQTHKSAEKFTQMLCYCCWLCFCQFLKFEQNKSIGCFSDVAWYYNSEVINIPHITTICVHVTEFGLPKPGPDAILIPHWTRYLFHFPVQSWKLKMTRKRDPLREAVKSW